MPEAGIIKVSDRRVKIKEFVRSFSFFKHKMLIETNVQIAIHS